MPPPDPSPTRSSPDTAPRWLLVSDVDDTLTGDDAALAAFARLFAERDDLLLALNSSRPTASIRGTLARLPVPLQPDALIGALGTEVEVAGAPDAEWLRRFGGWDRTPVDEVLADFGYPRHAEEYQRPCKASFAVPPEAAAAVEAAITARGVRARFLHSGTSDFDVIPLGAGKHAAVERLVERFAIPRRRLLVAGDALPDLDLFDCSDHGILVGNARPELRGRVDPARTYQAAAPHAGGVLEGLVHWGAVTAAELPARPAGA